MKSRSAHTLLLLGLLLGAGVLLSVVSTRARTRPSLVQPPTAALPHASNAKAQRNAVTVAPENAVPIASARAQGPEALRRYGALQVAAGEEQVSAASSPRIALAADFDADGVDDLLVAHNERLVLHRGDINAFAPQTQAAWEAIRDRRFVSPFERSTRSTNVPAAADFVLAGDFNRDARLDAAFAARGDNVLYVLEGDGTGNFPNLRRIELAGAITTLAAGDVNRADGLMDLIVGTRGADGFGLQVFSGLGNIFAASPLLYNLPAQAEAIAVGQLNENEFTDIAVAAGSDIIILSGADPTQPGATPSAEMQLLPQSANIKSLVAGDFLPDRDNRTELALLAADGGVRILKRGKLDTEPVTRREYLAAQVREYRAKGYPIPERISRQLNEKDLRKPAPRPKGDAQTWSQADAVATAAPPSGASAQALLTKGKISRNAAEDLIVLDASAKRMLVLPFVTEVGDAAIQTTFNGKRQKVEYAIEDQPVAILPMRLNADSKVDLLIVGRNQADFTALVSAPQATFTVTTAVDDIDNNLGNGVCGGPSGCTLRAAIMEANRLAGDDVIMINAGINPVISRGQPDNDGQGTNDQANGDLDITCVISNPATGGCDLPILSNQNDLSIIGAAGGNTVTAGTFTPYPVDGGGSINTDRVFDVGQDGIFGGGFGGSTGVSATFTNLTIQNGNVREALNTALGGGNRAFGGGIRYDGFGNMATHGSLTLTNSTIHNNQSDNAGGGVYHVFGSHTSSTVTYTSNITKAGEGGGLFFGAATSNSNVSITNSTFTANEARQGVVFGTFTANADGGGLRINADPNTVTINTTNFTNNIAQQDGGAIKTLGAQVTVTGGTMTGNTARRHGGVAFGDEDTANSPAFVTFSGSTMRNNTANSDNAIFTGDGNAGDGGAIFRDRGTLNITNCTIGGTGAGEPNTATNGGGVAHAFTVDSAAGNNSNQTTVTINGGSINGNVVNTDGGGVYFNSQLFDVAAGTLSIGQTTATALTSNKAKNNGGGIHVSNGATASLNNMTLRSNQANSDSSGGGDGGALYQNTGTTTFTGTLTVGGATFANTAVNGGGIRNNAGTVNIPSSASITHNTATGNGGGISNAGTLSALATPTITNNTATGNGGGIHNTGTLGAITTPTITNNSAATGGGVFSSSGALSITSGSVSSNTATSGKGGGIEHSGSSTSTITSVMINNNAGSGIHITGAGSLDAVSNTITGNSGDGITKIGTGTGSHFTSNTIHTNGELGIDLSDNGATANDPDDPDPGPNNLQNFPTIKSVMIGSGNYTIMATLDSVASTNFRVQFFANTACDPSMHGEGEILLGSQTVMTNASGDATVTVTFPVSGTREFITATATRLDGSMNPIETSEFSPCCEPIIISPASGALPQAEASVAYSQTFSTSDGFAPRTFAVMGALPNGIIFNAMTATISGAATQTGTFNFTVIATDAKGCMGTASYSLTVVCPTITLSPATLSNGTAGTAYNATISASPGNAPFNFTVMSGALPTGLMLNTSTGAITGTPTIAGDYTFMIKATDSTTPTGCSGMQTYMVNIACPTITVSSTPAMLPQGMPGTPYAGATISATPAGGNYTFMVTTGTLPAGLMLNAMTGAISGTPTTVSLSTFTVTATGFGICTGAQQFTIDVVCPTITLAPATLPDATLGVGYNQTVSASPMSTYTFSISNGALPAGLMLDASTGQITGTTTTTGNSTFTITATGFSGQCTGSQQYTINVVCPVITLSPGTLPNSMVGASYNQTVMAAPSSSYTFAVTGGALPPGLMLDTSTGLITGTTTAAGAFTFTITATGFGGQCSGMQSYTVNVFAPPTISKAFMTPGIAINGTSTLTITITNPAGNPGGLSGLSVTDLFPNDVVVASPLTTNNTCNGSLQDGTGGALAAGTNGIRLVGGAIATAGNSCSFSVNVTAPTAGQKVNVTGNVNSTEGGMGGTATATLNVAQAPTFAKSFTPTQVPLNGVSTLTFDITNPNAFQLTGVAFNDTLPSDLVLDTDPMATTTCNGTLTATGGTNVISLSGGSVNASSSCQITVKVKAPTGGFKNNVSGAISTDQSGTGGTASATLTVVAPPTITKAFGAANIAVGGTTSLTFTINNPSTVTQNGITFTDNLPAGLVVASPNGSMGVCGGTVTVVAGSNSISLIGGTLTGSGMCIIAVNVTGTAAGVQNNTTSTINSTEGGTGATSNTASVTVVAPPTISKAFGAASIALNGTTSLTFTINNLNTTVGLTGIAFTDNLPSGLVVATPNGLSGMCGGTVTATAGSGSISLSGGTLAASGSCMIAVNVTGTTSGSKNNTTGAITSTNGGTGATSNTATLVVGSPPTVSKAFGAASVPVGGTTSLSFTVTNIDTTQTLTGIGFTDNLPAGLVVTTPSGQTGSCGGGTITAVNGSGSISLSGATLAPGGTCTFAVNVTGTTAGAKNNTTGPITSTETGSGGTSNTVTLTVVAPPNLSKSFAPNTIVFGQTSTLSFTLTNPNTTVGLSGISFNDVLPAGLSIANSPATAACGGSYTVTAATRTLAFSGGTLTSGAPGNTCTFSVTVTGAAIGAQVNTTSPIASTEGGQAASGASATLTVNKADTMTAITSDLPDPSTCGQVVTVIYTVIPGAPGAGTPTGNVTVTDGVNSCTGTIAAGQCLLTLTTFGNRTLAANYVGDGNFNGSTSAGVPHQVNDTTAPVITCPANQVGVTNISAPNSPVAVNYPAPTVTDSCSNANVVCAPPSGSNFPLGTTTVNCTATDAASNTAACSFTVTVRQPRSAIKDLIKQVQALVPPLTQAGQLISQLELANTRVEQGQIAQACTHMQTFVNRVNSFVTNGQLTIAQGQSLSSYANKIRNALGCAGGPFPTFRAQTVGLYLAEQGEFKIKNRLTTGPAELSHSGGEPDDQPVAGDWDGDGVDTIGVYRQGVFYLRNTGGWAAAPSEEEARLNKRAEIVVAFGQVGDVPVVGDWNGDGIDTIGVFRQGVFLLRNSNTAGEPDLVINLGQVGDLPLAGDWDGDGQTTVGVYNQATGMFQLRNGWADGAGEVLVLWGGVDYLPIVGDWDGDGVTTIGLYSRSGEFLLRNTNTAGPAEIVLTLGLAGGLPLAGDWDGLP